MQNSLLQEVWDVANAENLQINLILQTLQILSCQIIWASYFSQNMK